MSLAEMSPLMRHKPLRDSRQPSEAQQHRMGACISSCNALATTAMTQQLQMTSSSAGSRKTLVRPLSQSALYLARPPSSSQMAHHHHQQTSLTNLVGSSYISSEGKNDMPDNQGQEPAKMDDWQRTPPQLEITLVYVSASAQLLVHIHRLSNATPPVRCPAKESTGTQVKVRKKKKQTIAYVYNTRAHCAIAIKPAAIINPPQRNVSHCDSSCVIIRGGASVVAGPSWSYNFLVKLCFKCLKFKRFRI